MTYRWTLADGLGLVVGLTALAWLPGAADPAAMPKLTVLLAGTLALSPFVLRRILGSSRPGLFQLLVASAAPLMALWGFISLIASDAPWQSSLFGWWGRGVGWLALLSVTILAVGAATLDRNEVRRALDWILGAAAIAAFIGLLQFSGLLANESGMGGAVTATMGNTNFSAAFFAITGTLAIGRAFLAKDWRLRTAFGALAAVLALLTWATATLQGPITFAAGAAAFLCLACLSYRGRGQIAAISGGAVLLVAGLAGVVMTLLRIGPFARLWQEETLIIREQYWLSAVEMLRVLPVFGTGPDGFARYVSELRPESYVTILDPTLRVSAAHNIALQIGATLGWPALALWLVLFVGSGILVVITVFRLKDRERLLAATVAAGLAAYLLQGMISIDMLPLLALGWALAGLSIGVTSKRRPQVEAPAPSGSSARARRAKAAAASWSPPAGPRQPTWTYVASAILAVAGLWIGGQMIALINKTQSNLTVDELLAFMEDPAAPCPARLGAVTQNVPQLPPEQGRDYLIRATRIDDRCLPLVILEADAALQVEDLPAADSASARAVELDPLMVDAWVVRGLTLAREGDVAGAQAALDRAEQLLAIYKDPAKWDPNVQRLRDELAGA